MFATAQIERRVVQCLRSAPPNTTPPTTAVYAIKSGRGSDLAMARKDRAGGDVFLYNDRVHVTHELTSIAFLLADPLALDITLHITFYPHYAVNQKFDPPTRRFPRPMRVQVQAPLVRSGASRRITGRRCRVKWQTTLRW